jgi:hypothetical protein
MRRSRLPSSAELSRLLYRFNNNQMSRMRELGIFLEGERIELLGGLVVRKPPRSPEAQAVLERLVKAFNRVLSKAGLNEADGEEMTGDDQVEDKA